MNCQKCGSYVPGGLALQECLHCGADFKILPPKLPGPVKTAAVPEPPVKPLPVRKKFPRFRTAAVIFFIFSAVMGFLWTRRIPSPPQVPPVLIVLGNHGDIRYESLENESTAENARDIVREHFEGLKLKPGQNIHVWLENAVPPHLAVSLFGSDAQQENFYKNLSLKLNFPLQDVLTGISRPEKLDPVRREIFMKTLRAIYESGPSDPTAAAGFKKIRADFFDQPLDWLKQRFGEDSVKIHYESSPFEAWLEMLRFAYLEDLDIRLLEAGDFEGFLKNDYRVVESLVKQIRLRDQKLAADIAAEIKRRPSDRQLVLRGMLHLPLGSELAGLGIGHELAMTSGMARITPFERHAYEWIKSKKTDFDPEQMTDADRKFLWLGLMTRLTETYLLINKIQLSKEKRKALFDVMERLSTPQIEEWKSILMEAMKRKGLEPSLATVRWLFAVSPRFRELLSSS